METKTATKTTKCSDLQRGLDQLQVELDKYLAELDAEERYDAIAKAICEGR